MNVLCPTCQSVRALDESGDTIKVGSVYTCKACGEEFELIHRAPKFQETTSARTETVSPIPPETNPLPVTPVEPEVPQGPPPPAEVVPEVPILTEQRNPPPAITEPPLDVPSETKPQPPEEIPPVAPPDAILGREASELAESEVPVDGGNSEATSTT